MTESEVTIFSPNYHPKHEKPDGIYIYIYLHILRYRYPDMVRY